MKTEVSELVLFQSGPVLVIMYLVLIAIGMYY